jgi:hypothetical protein
MPAPLPCSSHEPGSGRPVHYPGVTPLSQSHIAHINRRPGTVSGPTLVRCIGAVVALPGVIAFGVCLYAQSLGYDTASAIVGMVVGAQFAAIGWGIAHFAYLAGPVAPSGAANAQAKDH